MIKPDEKGYEEARLKEMARRLIYVLEEHPILSGMMTDEHQFYVKELLRSTWVPENETYELGEADYALEIGYDPLPE